MIGSKYIEGYTSEAEFCPYCGEKIGTLHADGSQTCDGCDKNFFVIEDDECIR